MGLWSSDLILEGSSRRDPTAPHLAPMGPRVSAATSTRFLLRPFPTSHTYRNLPRHGEGVLHVTDDALLLAKAAIGAVEPLPPVRPAEQVRGLRAGRRLPVLRVRGRDRSTRRSERVRIEAEVVHAGRLRDFFGFNRAKHAVVEAAILATRLHLLPPTRSRPSSRKLRVIVDKTGGPAEHAAMDLPGSEPARSGGGGR